MSQDQGRRKSGSAEPSAKEDVGSGQKRGVVPDKAGERLDKALAAERPELSRTQWKALVAGGSVLVNGRVATKAYLLSGDDLISVDEKAVAALLHPSLLPWPAAFEPGAAFAGNTDPVQANGDFLQGYNAEPFVLISKTQDYIAISKPSGIPSHPHKPSENRTALHAFLAIDPAVAAAGSVPLEGGLVHRLDTDTSGLLIAARSPAAYRSLTSLLRRGQSLKTYLAFVEGDLSDVTRVRFSIAHHATKATRMVAVADNGVLEVPHALAGGPHRGKPREAESLFIPLARFDDCTFVAVALKSAQMHQVRVHAAALGLPLLADGVYGKAVTPGQKSGGSRHSDPNPGLFQRHALHAWRIVAPGLELEAPLPKDFELALHEKGAKGAEILVASVRKLDYS